MKKKNHLLFIVTAALVAGPLVAQAQGYDYESVDYPGASTTNLFGVNNRGDAVGNGFVDPDNLPFVFDTKDGTFTNFALVAGFDSISVIGISDSGVVVGSVVDDSAGIESGLILDQNGTVTVFDHPLAFNFTQARAVNNQGLVTGYRGADGPFEAAAGFIYNPKTDTFTDIVPSLFTIAQGINSKGDVVGHAIFLPTDDPCDTGAPGTARHGWVRTKDGKVTYFIVNGQRTSARGISDSGTVVGFVTDPFTGVTKGFVTELDGTQCQAITIADEALLQFPGAIETFVQGITNSGVVVGSYRDEFGIGGGFVATSK